MKFFLIAGEASGDLHASNLMKALRVKDPQAMFVGLGGDKMREEGCDIRVDYREMAYMGFVAMPLKITAVPSPAAVGISERKTVLSTTRSQQSAT